MNELDFIAQLKEIAPHPAARGLADDAAVLPFGRHKLVLTHDMMVEGVHFLADAQPGDVAWKLVAISLSDLAAKGAKPLGLLLGYGKSRDDDWDSKFIAGIKEAISHFGVPLLGGDTVTMAEGCKHAFGLTALGEAKGHIVPARCGAVPGHAIYVTGNIGDGWAGLQIAKGLAKVPDVETAALLLKAYNRPMPKLDEGRALSSLVSSLMDVSDGLLLDASRIADASGIMLEIDLDRVPLSDAFKSVYGEDEDARKQAATGGDDYQLLLTAGPGTVLPISLTRIGRCRPGKGVSLVRDGEPANLPESLGFLHG